MLQRDEGDVKAGFVSPPRTTQQTCPISAAPPISRCVPHFPGPLQTPLLHTWGFISLGEGGMVVVSFLDILKEARGEERDFKMTFPLFRAQGKMYLCIVFLLCT